MPLVNFDAMRQAYFRDGKATHGDIIFWSKPGSWKLQCLTPNTSVRYAFSFVNTSQAGPVVVDLPASGDASLMGTILDAWQVPMTDIGLAGEDQGKGGKYLLMPPGYQGKAPDGYFVLPMKTFNSLVGLRLIVKSEDKASVTKALQCLKQICCRQQDCEQCSSRPYPQCLECETYNNTISNNGASGVILNTRNLTATSDTITSIICWICWHQHRERKSGTARCGVQPAVLSYAGCSHSRRYHQLPELKFGNGGWNHELLKHLVTALTDLAAYGVRG